MIRDQIRLAKMRARAVELVGTPWRLLGRDPETGLDCVGALLEIYRAGGVTLPDVDPLGVHKLPREAAMWECFDRTPHREHGMPGDVALWPVEDDGTRWTAHVAVLFGNQFFTANEARGVHACDMRKHLIALAKLGRPKPEWFRLREECA